MSSKGTSTSGFRLIVYDLDGTLVDTLEDITNAANHMLAKMQAPPLTSDQVRRFIGRGMQQLVGECLRTNDPERIAEGLKIYLAYYQEHLTDHSRLYPHARQVLDYFRGRAQAVVTNKPNPYSRNLLQALGVADYFLDIIGGDSPYPKKPDPPSLLALMRRVGSPAPETLLIGDSPIDVETGRRAAVMTVSVRHGLADREELACAAADVTVESFQDLLTLARKHAW